MLDAIVGLIEMGCASAMTFGVPGPQYENSSYYALPRR